MKVRFSVAETFLEELRHERENVEDRMVRATYRSEQSKDVPFLSSMSVVAGYVVCGKLIELHQVCGDVVHEPPVHAGNAKTKARAEQIMHQIENAVDRLGCVLRRGVFEQ